MDYMKRITYKDCREEEQAVSAQTRLSWPMVWDAWSLVPEQSAAQ